MKQWMLKRNAANLKKISKRYGITEIFAEILVKRGLYDWDAMNEYLYPDISRLHLVHDIKDMDQAVKLLYQKIAKGQKIQIIGDYDVDGVMSTTILYLGLKKMDADVCWRIPHRARDGYGVRATMAEEAKENGIDTLITCDNGISAIEAVIRAKELGMTVIITDHHEVPVDIDTGKELIPPADAIVDPKQSACPYPFKEMCGAGIAFRLIEALWGERKEEKLWREFVTMAAIATVCDVVPLQKENRAIVKAGLKYIENTTNIGLSSLIRQLDLKHGVNTGVIGFRIGPCINAAGRLDDAALGVALLTEEDPEKANQQAAHLIQLNEDRKAMTEQAVQKAIAYIEEERLLERNVLVVLVEGCSESVAGIVAGRVREKYYRPTMILTRSKDRLKGSGRSIPGYHMQSELNRCKDLLIEYGGHAMAAGFSLKEENLSELNDRLNANCQLTEKDLIEKITFDREVPLWEINGKLVQELSLLEPVGEQNPGALLAKRGLEIRRIVLRGAEKRVGSIQLVDEGRRFTVVDFDVELHIKKTICEKYSQEMWEAVLAGHGEGCIIDILYRPSVNEKYRELQYTIVDCR